ncbi:hypothetical protein JAAARDRAFT_331949 [Jaapia argillacea MUCL 33604]|uniref:Thiamine pyrophosphokinase n=1 Tax=Jaapia argillacea MUCL 33604 TaxID=933084 RepID=A0A067PX53_9AGAM|nr:hypothetical protein JAAARDRAFT_331949 [Jaapia argillacea MUCL 33604]
MSPRQWSTTFLQPQPTDPTTKFALIILNQPFSFPLLDRLWNSCEWRCCADGGANRLYDSFESLGLSPEELEMMRKSYLPDLVKGDLDSVRDEVREYYSSLGVRVIHDHDQYSTDLMKCISAIQEKEKAECTKEIPEQYTIILLGGLSGRLDQTVHTLSLLHKLRKTRRFLFAVTDDNVGWVLDEGEHIITIDHSILGPTCGLLPVGIDSTILSTKGLRWNLDEKESCFDGLVSTSNHLVPEEQVVWIKTTKPIWWVAELRTLS